MIWVLILVCICCFLILFFSFSQLLVHHKEHMRAKKEHAYDYSYNVSHSNDTLIKKRELLILTLFIFILGVFLLIFAQTSPLMLAMSVVILIVLGVFLAFYFLPKFIRRLF